MPHRLAAAVGAFGQRVAERYLVDQGLVVLDRNWRCRIGEIDLVARDGDCLVVCEVKTRRGSAFGTPAESVTWAKLARLRRLAAAWAAAHPEHSWGDIRVDVVGVVRPPSGPSLVEHLKGVG
ncbi:MAG TPA: YraN family protein [Dermatophilaceae bacterium]|mgnify:CR=1 FL=1|nr:YraN family protein [Dermatophilaceae bacterium]